MLMSYCDMSIFLQNEDVESDVEVVLTACFWLQMEKFEHHVRIFGLMNEKCQSVRLVHGDR